MCKILDYYHILKSKTMSIESLDAYCAVRNSVDIVFFFKMSLMISFRTEIMHMHIIYHRLIYNGMFEHLRLENKTGISCKIK